jgi:hypothetical protein
MSQTGCIGAVAPQIEELADAVSKNRRAFKGHEVKRCPRAYATLLAKPINETSKHEPPTLRVSSAHFVIRNISVAESNHSLLSFRIEGERYDRLQPTGSF